MYVHYNGKDNCIILDILYNVIRYFINIIYK